MGSETDTMSLCRLPDDPVPWNSESFSQEKHFCDLFT